jgi:hypothetical protein
MNTRHGTKPRSRQHSIQVTTADEGEKCRDNVGNFLPVEQAEEEAKKNDGGWNTFPYRLNTLR